jgi:sugar phosphate isomerase/epimerase
VNRAVPSLKGCFPFRLGTTSYVLPDAILPNVRFLADLVDDVELVLFESNEISNLPSPQEIDELAAIAAARDLTYTVHLPLDAKLGSPDEPVRRQSVAACAQIVALTRPLRPFAYVAHLYGEDDGRAPTQDTERWHRNLALSVAELADAGVIPRDLCVETLAYPFRFVEPLVERMGLSVCLDVGHMLLGG